MKMHKSDFTGTGKVYRFSLQQLIKNKANIVSSVIMLVLALCAVPLITLIAGENSSSGEPMDTAVVYIQNDTPYELDIENLQKENPIFADTDFKKADFPAEEYKVHLSQDDIFVSIYKSAEEGVYYIKLSYPEGNVYADSEAMNTLENVLTECFDQARYEALDATPEQLQVVMSGYETGTELLSEYLEADDVSWEVHYFLQLAYSVIILMISILTVSYIIRAVVEEKASKLVELLMTSVKPMALVVGKILATMTYVMGNLIIVIAGVGVSYGVSSLFLDVSPIKQMLTAQGLTADLLRISPLTLIVVLVSVLLGYLTYAILAGLLGACCSTIEDTQSAMMVPTMLCMLSYLVACITSAAGGSTGVTLFTSLFPFVSVFCGPIHYLLGDIGFGTLAVAWLLQAVVIILLFVFSARIYQELIIYRGSRVKISRMIAMARGTKSRREEN